jgi:hypothetical protein
MSPNDVKQTLLSLEEPKTEFSVIFSGKKSRKVNGLYKSESREIIIQNRNFLTENGTDENLLLYTAIHEYAHHLHSERRGGKLPPRAHGPEFWAIFHELLEKAESKSLYHTGIEDSPELSKITALIKEKYLTQNGIMFKEFGGLLSSAGKLCAAIGLRFEDYLDRILCIPKTAAKLAIKSFEYDINPTLGVDNMRYVAALRPEENRLAAEKSFLLGKSPDAVKTRLKNVDEPPGFSDAESERLLLQKEKERLERTIAGLQKRLHEVELKLEETD